MIRSKKWWLAVAILLAAILVLSLRRPAAETGSRQPREIPSPVRTRASQPDFDKERETSDAASRKRMLTEWDELLAWLHSEPAPSHEEIKARLLATRVAWAEMDLHVLSGVLGTLLDSGVDGSTGLDFQVGPHGFLRSWPTLRVFLLDVLAASDPEMAAGIARAVIDKTDSGDEYAVALRSLTRPGMGRATDEELVARFSHLLAQESWQQFAGFAEAMDLPRVVGNPQAIRELAAWNGNPAVKAMALHEYAAEQPANMLAVLNEAGTNLPNTARASLMARANPADAAQLAAVDAYLHRPDLTPEETAEFFNAFPLRSTTTGYRLYGKTPSPYNFEQIAAGDRAALERVDVWLKDPALANHRAEIGSLRKRLAAWTEQAR